jgi:tRNA dimethylallyltransferase
MADEAVRRIRARGRLPIVVGGTGLWIRALVRGLVEVPPPDPEVRQRLEALAAAEGPAALHARLAEVDPVTAAAVHPHDGFRIIRALEVYEQTGTPLGDLRARHALGKSRYRTVLIVLDMDRIAHDGAIRRRIAQMLEAGWADEVRALRTRWGDEVRPFGSVGYREVLAHVRDAVPLEETIRQIRKSTRTYARRQRTWFRSEPGVSWRGQGAELRDPGSLERIAKDLNL